MTTRLLGRYRLDGLLGTGAFATVHAGHDEQLDDPVAIKTLAANHAANPEIRARFVTEGQILRRLDSPHLVRVHDLAENDDGLPFLVLELCERGTLRDRVRELRRTGWTPTDADIGVLADALHAAIDTMHSADVVHRDLTPANILLTTNTRGAATTGPTRGLVRPDERIVVTDLGFCKDIARSTGITAAVGTDGFQPPEQRQVGGLVDVRSDLWAASAVTSWMATGQTSQLPATAEAAMLGVGISQPVAAAVAAGLHPNPARRPATPQAWIDPIRAALPTTANPASGSTTPAPAVATPRPGSIDRRWMIGAAALVMLLVVIGWRAGADPTDDGLEEFFDTRQEQAESAAAQEREVSPAPPAPAVADPVPTPTPEPTPTDPIAANLGPAGSGEWTFGVFDADGWTYDVHVQIQDAAYEFVRADSDPRDPPGTATLLIGRSGTASVEITPNTPGRTPPEAGVDSLRAHFDGPRAAFAAGGCGPPSRNRSLPGTGLYCPVFTPADADGPPRLLPTDTVQEADRIDRWIANYQGKAPDRYYLGLDVSIYCELILFPDGRIGRIESFLGDSGTCQITGDNTFTIDDDT